MAASIANTSHIMTLLYQIENKIAYQLRLCQECKQLFRPWPQKKDMSETPGKSVRENVAEEISENKLTQQEEEELALMDKLLNKAQRVQEKLKKKEETSKGMTVSETRKEISTNCVQGMDIISKTFNHPNSRCSELINSKDNKDTEGNAQCKDTEGNPQCSDKSVTRTALQPVKLPTKSNKSLNMGFSKSQQNKVSNNNKKQTDVKSAGKRTVSAHVKAPFQTNAALTVPKRSSTQQAMVTGRRPTSARSKPQGKAAVVLKNTGTQSKLNPVEQSSGKYKKTETQVLDVKCSDHLQENQTTKSLNTELLSNDISDHPTEKQEVSHRSIENCVSEKEEDKVEKKKVTDEEINTTATVVQHPTVEKPFCLKTHGQNLKIPVKLRKCCATNDGLRKKLYMQRVTKKVDVPHKGHCFVEKLESSFTDPEVFNNARQFRNLLNSYISLLALFKSLQLDTLSENSSAHEVLRAKKLMEMILTCFSEVEEARLSIKISVPSGYNFTQSHTSCEHTLLKLIDDTISGIPSWWLQSCMKPSSELAVPIQGGIIQYRSYRDLQKYRRLLFQVQYQALQCHMVEYYGQELLPLLQSLDPTSSDYLHVLRAIYSLLSDGKSFMVVVRDTIQELEDTVIDTDS